MTPKPSQTLIQKLSHYMPLWLPIFAIVLFISCGEYAFAQDLGSTPDIFDSIKIILGVVLNIIYIIIWPILVLAGTAMDNTLVYGGFINLDKPLFLLRNISRTFANFVLVAVIIGEIVKMIGKQDVDKKKMVINLFIAGVGINASRFVLGGLLDISTIATYGIGALPMTTLQQVRQEKMPIMMIHSYLNLSTDDSDKPLTSTVTTGTSTVANEDITTSLLKYNSFINNHVYYSRGSIEIPTCEVHNGYIIGATQYPYILDKKGIPMNGVDLGSSCPPGKSGTCTHLYCALGPTIMVDLQNFEREKRDALYDRVKGSIESTIDTNARENEINKRMNNEVKIVMDHINLSGCTSVTGTYTTLQSNDIQKIMSAAIGANVSDKGKKVCDQKIESAASSSSFMSIIDGDTSMQNQGGMYLEELMEKSQGLVGPLVTIYISILDFSNITSVSDTMKDTTSVGVIIEFIMKAAAAIFMIIPLITLALVMLMRVGILWAMIAFSPFLVILWVFKESSIVSGVSGSTEKYTSVKAVIGLIFAPVVPVFALGIGMIIIQTLQLRMHEGLGESQSTRGFLGVNFQATGVGDDKSDNNETCADFWGLTQLCYDTGSDTETGSIYNDLFGWIVMNILAIGIMRAIVKASFAASSITSSIATKTMDLGTSLLSSIPLVRIPGSNGTKLSVSNLGKIPGKIENAFDDKFAYMSKGGEEAINKIVDEVSGVDKGSTKSGSLVDLSAPTKKSIGDKFNSLSDNTIEGMKKVVTEESSKEAKDKDILASVASMDNTQLLTFLNNLEENKLINATRKAELSKIVKVDNIRQILKDYDTEHGIKSEAEANKFITEINTPENIEIIKSKDIEGVFGEGQVIGIKDGKESMRTDKEIKYDKTSGMVIIYDPTSTGIPPVATNSQENPTPTTP